jgi:hypothetical protein
MAGFWRKVAGAFVEFEDAPAKSDTVDDDLAKAEALVRELDARASAPSTPQVAPVVSPVASPRPASPPPPPPAPPPVAGPGTSPVGSAPDVPEGATYASFYAEAGLPSVHHTAEQMLAILDGLAAMPREASRLAVKAMDDADDRWTVDDVIGDGRRKRQVLEAVVAKLHGWAGDAEARAASEVAEADAVEKQAEATIEEQIAQLRAELDAFRAEAAERRVQAQTSLQASRDAVARETARMQSELYRLSRLEAFFEAPATPNPTPPAR